MTIKHCAYWLNLRGYPDIANEVNVTVQVPRIQTFTPETLGRMMRKINDSEAL